jgi:mannonate dehydratase
MVRFILRAAKGEYIMMAGNENSNKVFNPVNDSASGIPEIVMYPALARPTEEYLLFIRQIGIESVLVAGIPKELQNLEGLLSIKKLYTDAGLKVYSVMGPIGIQPKEIVLNMPGRDEKIDEYLNWIRLLGQAGFRYTNSGFLGATGVWTTGKGGASNSRGAATREFNENEPTLAQLSQNTYFCGRNVTNREPSFKVDEPAFGREYTREEILENFTYFIRKVVPVAEDIGVYVGFHPDDPPVYKKMAGVARIFSDFESIKEVLQVADSPNIGLILCGGIWLEGGEKMGADITEAIDWFVSNKKTWEVHFRNVSSPLPRFLETFPDNGYRDMYTIMKALVDAGYSGAVHLDHALDMVGAPYSYPAFSTGYMKACLQRALAESNNVK